MRLYWSPEYVGGDEDTLAKSVKVIDLVRNDPNVTIRRPHLAELSELVLAHSETYLENVFARRVGAGVSVTERSLLSVRYSTGGVIEAAFEATGREVNSGSASSGLHHARRTSGNGFCTFNGLAVAARCVGQEWAELGGEPPRVHIVDLDAHCGGGTWDILRGDMNVTATDVSVDRYDEYVPGRAGWTLDHVTEPGKYLKTIQDALPAQRFDLVIYNAGMDPWEGSYIGGLEGITAEMLAERDAMVFEWAKTFSSPVAFVFAGGYGDLDAIAAMHAQTVRLAAA